jgi:hypothetical protein
MRGEPCSSAIPPLAIHPWRCALASAFDGEAMKADCGSIASIRCKQICVNSSGEIVT